MTGLLWIAGDLLLSVGKVALILLVVAYAVRRSGVPAQPKAEHPLPSTRRQALPATQTREPLPRRNRRL